MGYHRAGWDVVGVDVKPHPNYPFHFIKADALSFPLDGFDAYHASPPCQGYSHAVTQSHSQWVSYSIGKATPRLIADVRSRLVETGKPYVIENVIGASDHLINPITLCGSMFSLNIPRHRLFESNVLIMQPFHPKCAGIARNYAEAQLH